MKTPNWAQDLILNAILYLQSKGFQCDLPVVKWYNAPKTRWGWRRDKPTKRKSSTGICYRNYISIRYGTDRRDCKLVLLHELAHWALPLGSETHEGHTDRFWDLAFDLYREFGLPLRVCLKRERNYRKGSIRAYRKLKR
mgnify:CR=1 FL=1